MIRSALLLVAALSLAAAPALAAASDDEALQDRIGFDQSVGADVPLGLELVGADGARTTLGAAAGGRPTVLVMAWYSCGMLCPITLGNLARTLAALDFEAGRDFNLVVVGLSPEDGPAVARKTRGTMLAQSGVEDPAGWHLLSGDGDGIDRLAEAIGFRYARDPATGEVAHPAGAVILTPEGRVARYLFGLDIAPSDMKFALMEASEGALGSVVDRIALRCQSFDPSRGEYTPAILGILRVAGTGTVVVLAGAIGFMALRRRRA